MVQSCISMVIISNRWQFTMANSSSFFDTPKSHPSHSWHVDCNARITRNGPLVPPYTNQQFSGHLIMTGGGEALPL